MASDFSTARALLEEAYEHLHGNDRTSQEARRALDLLMEALATAEFSRKPAVVIPFPCLRTCTGQN